MRGVRRPALLFALGSAIYWQCVVWFIGLINPLAGTEVAPLWLMALANFGSAAVYAVAALTFCHRLARRAIKQAQLGTVG